MKINSQIITIIISFSLASILAANVFAADKAGSLNASIGLASQDFGYKEFSDDGRLLNREDGWLPGISGALLWQSDQYFLNVSFTYLKGNVVYKGQTQSGAPHKTKTNEQIVDISVSLGILDVIQLVKPSALYFGLGFREWQRDILPTNAVLGLFETYYWYYGFIGGRVQLLGKEKWAVWLDGRFTRPINPIMNICLLNYDCADLSLGVNLSGRVSLPIYYQLRANSKLIVEPYFESWDFGRSPNETLTINGMPVGATIYEPRSETRNIGITISISSQF